MYTGSNNSLSRQLYRTLETCEQHVQVVHIWINSHLRVLARRRRQIDILQKRNLVEEVTCRVGKNYRSYKITPEGLATLDRLRLKNAPKKTNSTRHIISSGVYYISPAGDLV